MPVGIRYPDLMVIAPNALSPRLAPYSDDQATQVIPRIASRPRLLRSFLLIMIPVLLVALATGALVGRELAPATGAAIGVVGAALALWVALRRAGRTT